jgi:23S rRNA pseudouridine1911/1915/1917 synthase
MSRPPPDLSKPRTEKIYVVTGDEEGLRLDVFLRQRVRWRSREHMKDRIRSGEVLLNGRQVKVSQTVKERDQVFVSLVRMGDPFDPADIPLPVLYEDEFLVALNKPAGFVVHPVGRHQNDTIINALHLKYRRPEDPGNDIVPKLAHRIDQFTSGVLLVAKRDDVRAEMGRQFACREVEKHYLAIVKGVPDPAAGDIEAPIGIPTDGTKLPMVIRDDGEPSLTRYQTLEAFCAHAFVRLRPYSGRTHQIRIHMQYLGTPLVADRMYGDGEPLVIDGETILDRYPLHSALLAFTHPVTREEMRLTAPLPEDMEQALQALRGARRRSPRTTDER